MNNLKLSFWKYKTYTREPLKGRYSEKKYIFVFQILRATK